MSAWPFTGKTWQKKPGNEETNEQSVLLKSKEQHETVEQKKSQPTMNFVNKVPPISRSDTDNQEDVVYNVIDSIEEEVHENHKILLVLMKRVKTLDSRCKKYETIIERLGEFLDKQTSENVRQHNRSLRMRVPVPFKSTHTLFASELKETQDGRHEGDGLKNSGSVSQNEIGVLKKELKNNIIEAPMPYPFHLKVPAGQPTCTAGFHRDV